MREVTLYYAFDETEFDNMNDCYEYEGKAYDLVYSIAEKYSFFDENMKEIVAPWGSPNIEDFLNWIEDAYNRCAYIKKLSSLTDDEVAIIRKNIGIIGIYIYNKDFSCAVGLFKYDNRIDKWVKVDE